MSKKHNITGISQLSCFMQGAYNKLNSFCFDSSLPHLMITFESGAKHKAYGWAYTKKMWDTSNGKKYSIVIATEFLRDHDNVLRTLVHEMCHIYAMENGLKDTSRGGYYHNNTFKEIAEKAHLICTKEGQGWATRDEDEALKAVYKEIMGDAFITFNWANKTEHKGGKEEGDTEDGNTEDGNEEGGKGQPKKKSGYYIFRCSQCGATIRTTKADRVIACLGTANQLHEAIKMTIEN